MLNISVWRGISFNVMGRSVHTPPAQIFSVLKVGVAPVKCHGDAGNNEINEVAAIKKVMG